jgi:hypothetical protein
MYLPDIIQCGRYFSAFSSPSLPLLAVMTSYSYMICKYYMRTRIYYSRYSHHAVYRRWTGSSIHCLLQRALMTVDLGNQSKHSLTPAVLESFLIDIIVSHTLFLAVDFNLSTNSLDSFLFNVATTCKCWFRSASVCFTKSVILICRL